MSFVAHAWEVRVMECRENHSYGNSETKNYFVLQAYCPSLLIDFNETCTTCSALLEGSRCVIAVKSFLWKPRYSRKGTLFSMESASHY